MPHLPRLADQPHVGRVAQAAHCSAHGSAPQRSEARAHCTCTLTSPSCPTSHLPGACDLVLSLSHFSEQETEAWRSDSPNLTEGVSGEPGLGPCGPGSGPCTMTVNARPPLLAVLTSVRPPGHATPCHATRGAAL